jgi:Mg-chelatase subunit ChlD/uncharacterized membrane protein
MTILYPWVLLLLLPIGMFLYSKREKFNLVTLALRLSTATFIVFALSAPNCTLNQNGIDVVVVVDRSSSMPAGIDKRAVEIITLLETEKQTGDRIAVISTTKEAFIEKNLTNDNPFQGFQKVQDVDNSNLPAGIQIALDIIPNNRAGRILLITDGENTGPSYSASRKEAQSRSIPIHIRYLPKVQSNDVAITHLDYPDQASSGESVPISAWISSPIAQEANIILRRNGSIIASGKKSLTRGNNSISLIDNPQQGGINQYELEVQTTQDSQQENNKAIFGSLIKGPKKVLLLNSNATQSSLATILIKNNVALDIKDPRKVLLSTALLTRYQSVILQDVPSTYFSNEELSNIANFVRDMGGGLLMTGGPTSFGAGGYLHTEIEKILPVQLEIREQHRKIGLALGIALDRSGSMSVSIGPNLTKMDLANQGAAAALELLTPIDSTAVYAVDTEPHEILRLQDVQNNKQLISTVLGIESAGGGIYVGEALKKLYEILPLAKQQNRHVALFADANDAVDQGEVFETIEKMREANITISVIALGNPTDSDASFLANVARKGGGDIYFTTNPTELPKLFAMDTMLASKSAFSEGPTAIEVVLGLTGLGGGRFPSFPTIEGYNIAYYKKSAQVGYKTKDTEPIDPIVAYHRYGLGMTVAYLGQIDGTYGTNIRKWKNYSPFFHSIVQAISAKQPPSLPYVGVEKEGNYNVYTVESKEKIPQATIITPNGESLNMTFIEIDDDLYQGKMEKTSPGIHVVQITGKDSAITLPPSSLPYSNEFQNRNTSIDQRELQRLSRLTYGKFNAPVNLIFEGSRESKSLQSLQYILALIGLMIFLFEIANRRLHLISGPKFITAKLSQSNKLNYKPVQSLTVKDTTLKENFIESEEISVPEKKKPGIREALVKAKNKRR